MKNNAGNHVKKCYPGYPRKQVSYLPYRICYRRFFAGMKPPEGLRRSNSHNPNIRYICQRPDEKRKSRYGTMFDESLGLAVFSAYTLTTKDVDFQHRARPASWAKTPGISLKFWAKIAFFRKFSNCWKRIAKSEEAGVRIIPKGSTF